MSADHAAFVHLRVHSAFSLLEGALRIEELVGLCQDARMPAVAVTDTANLFGALQFCAAAAKSGVQPIVGCLLGFDGEEAERPEVGRPAPPPRLLFLVKDRTGYTNLMKLLTRAYFRGEPGEPARMGLDDLRAHNAGLLVLTGGPDGPIGRALLRGHAGRAEALLRELAAILDGRLYVELMRHGLDAELRTEPAFLEFADVLGLPLVATNDVHFATADMHEAHDALLCIADGAQLAQDDRRRLTPEHRFKTPEEMAALFEDVPEAVANTLAIARRCAFMVTPHAPMLPAYPTEGGRSEAEQLRAEAAAGLERRLDRHVLRPEQPPEAREAAATPYRERLAYELGVIEQMQYPGYFLIVSEFIRWAKGQGIPVGPGRGSGAGSVVAWALEITDLDPLRFGLLFERFLNPERVSMPDFDVDFCQDRRDAVIQHVRERYGEDRVASIITFGRLQPRAVLRDVGRVMGLPYGLVDRICKLVPFNPANPPTLRQSLDMEPRLEEARRSDPQIARLIDVGLRLEGLPRHASTHAAGVVIGERPLDELVPLYRDPRSGTAVTQFNMKDVEKAGLVKFDFLGLTTLTLLKLTVDLLRARGVELDLARLPFDDPPTYDLLSRAETAGVFQLESGGIRDALRNLRPNCLEDVIAIGALYRPGPMDNIPRYCNCKHGREQPSYLHPRLEPILKETHGVIIYQEQVMEIAREMAGYSLGAADILRRAMGKKDRDEMAAQREVFVEGAVGRGIERRDAELVFDQVAKFASYGFNKSHAAAYAVLAYQTAYLKANHPVEFFAASMTLERANQDKLNLFRQEMARAGIRLLPPDVNRSGVDFTVEDTPEGPAIRHALSAIRGVGAQAMAALVTERERGGPYRDLFDLTGRLCPAGNVLNKRLLEGLVRAGAFDGLDRNRARLCAALEPALRYGAARSAQAASSQASLFGTVLGEEPELPRPELPAVDDYPALDRLQQEFEALGFYLSAHPLDGYRSGLDRLGVVPAAGLVEHIRSGRPPLVRLAGMVLGKQERSTERSRFAFVQLSDPTGTFEVTLFSEVLGRARELLDAGRPLLITGDARLEGEAVKILASSVEGLDERIAAATGGAGGRGTVEIRLRDAGAVERLPGLLTTNGEAAAKVRLILPIDDGEEVTLALPEAYGLPFARRVDLEGLPGVAAVRDL